MYIEYSYDNCYKEYIIDGCLSNGGIITSSTLYPKYVKEIFFQDYFIKFPDLSNCKLLETITLYYCDDFNLPDLSKCSSLKNLYLTYTDTKQLNNLPKNIENIGIYKTRINNLCEILDLENLESITYTADHGYCLNWTNMTDIYKLEKLKKIEINGLNENHYDLFIQDINKLPNLEKCIINISQKNCQKNSKEYNFTVSCSMDWTEYL